MNARLSTRAGLALGLFATTAAHATNGYLPHGYGVQAKGAAGVAAALPQDSLVIATNPAGLVAVGNRLDLGVEWFHPVRESSIEGNAFGPDATYDANSTSSFYIPEIGYSHGVSDNVALGVAVYGNGGMNTDYATSPYTRFLGPGKLSMNLEQLFVAPAAAVKVGDRNTFGLALNLAYQRFELKGASGFAGFSSDPSNLSDNDVDSSTGYGVRVGWLGDVTDAISVGASWQSRTYMSAFDKYAGLFAGQGDFDIPETAVLGIAVKANDAVTIGIDWQTIKYSDVAAVGHRSDTLFTGGQLGADNGPGFGWDDVRVLKVGTVYKASDTLTLRAGFSHSTQAIPDSQTFINAIAPGVVQDHLTLGGTWAFTDVDALSVEYAHAYARQVAGDGSIPAGMPPAGLGGGEMNLRMHEDMLGVAWSRKL